MKGVGIGTVRSGAGQYLPLAVNYFMRCEAKGEVFTVPQKIALNAKFLELIVSGQSVCDRLFAYKYVYTATQALIAFIWNGLGTDLATAVGSPAFTAGTGFTQNGTSYINTSYNANTNGTNYTLNNAGIYMQFSGYRGSGNNIYFGNGLTHAGSTVLQYSSNFVSLNSDDSSSITLDASIVNVSLVRTDNNTVKFNANGYSEIVLNFASSSVRNANFCDGADSSYTDRCVPNGAISEMICFGNSTLNRITIIAALST